MSSPPFKRHRMETEKEGETQTAASASSGEAAGGGKGEVIYELEYETQFLGFAPKSFIDSIYNVMLENFQQKTEDLKTVVSDQFPAAMSEEEMKNAMAHVQTAMLEWLHGKFIDLEEFAISKVFAIAPYVLLPEDEVQQDERLALVNKAELRLEIRDLEKQLHALKFMKDQIDEEKEILQQVLEMQGPAKEALEKAVSCCQSLDRQIELDEQEVKHIAEVL